MSLLGVNKTPYIENPLCDSTRGATCAAVPQLSGQHESFRRERALLRLPSLLEYLGYVYSFAGALVGPVFELSVYLDHANGLVKDNVRENREFLDQRVHHV